jgi:hypothetical protein
MFLSQLRSIIEHTFLGQPRNITLIFLGQPMNITDEHNIFFKKKYLFCPPPQLGSLQNRHIETAAYT